MQKALVEQNKLREQLENSEDKFQLQRNELTKMHSEEKLMLVQVLDIKTDILYNSNL